MENKSLMHNAVRHLAKSLERMKAEFKELLGNPKASADKIEALLCDILSVEQDITDSKNLLSSTARLPSETDELWQKLEKIAPILHIRVERIVYRPFKVDYIIMHPVPTNGGIWKYPALAVTLKIDKYVLVVKTALHRRTIFDWRTYTSLRDDNEIKNSERFIQPAASCSGDDVVDKLLSLVEVLNMFQCRSGI